MKRRTLQSLALAALGLGLAATTANAQTLRDKVKQTEDVGLVRQEGAVPDRTLTFTNHLGETVTLGSAIQDDMPVVLLLAYFDCPLICPLTMQNLSRAASDMENMIAGEDYRLLVISFDHNDTTDTAKLQRERFLGPGFSHVPKNNGALFWTAEPPQVKQLADTVGFYYKYLPDVDEFSHTSALVILEADGTVHNYYPGIKYEPESLRKLLLEAGSGAERTLIDQAALFCFVWRPDENKWVISPIRVMQLIGGASVVLIAATLGTLFIIDRNRWSKRNATPA